VEEGRPPPLTIYAIPFIIYFKETIMRKQDLENLKRAIDANIGGFEDGEQLLTAVNNLGISGSITKVLNFDSNGNTLVRVSFYCPLNLNITARIDGLDAFFDVVLNTNYPQQSISAHVKTNTFSSTVFSIDIHSSIPNAQATATLDYST
jgi:hypothetical protein